MGQSAAGPVRRPAIAEGKVRANYVLTAKLAEDVAVMAVRERKRTSAVVERLLVKGLEAEGHGAVESN